MTQLLRTQSDGNGAVNHVERGLDTGPEGGLFSCGDRGTGGKQRWGFDTESGVQTAAHVRGQKHRVTLRVSVIRRILCDDRESVSAQSRPVRQDGLTVHRSASFQRTPAAAAIARNSTGPTA